MAIENLLTREYTFTVEKNLMHANCAIVFCQEVIYMRCFFQTIFQCTCIGGRRFDILQYPEMTENDTCPEGHSHFVNGAGFFSQSLFRDMHLKLCLSV